MSVLQTRAARLNCCSRLEEPIDAPRGNPRVSAEGLQQNPMCCTLKKHLAFLQQLLKAPACTCLAEGAQRPRWTSRQSWHRLPLQAPR